MWGCECSISLVHIDYFSVLPDHRRGYTGGSVSVLWVPGFVELIEQDESQEQEDDD